MRYEAMAAPANENAAEAAATISFGSVSDGGFLLNLLQKGSRLEKDKDKNSHAKPSKQEQEQQEQQNSDEVTNFHDPAVAALGPSHPLDQSQSQSQSQSSPHGSHIPWISARVSGFPNPATSSTIEQGLISAGQGLEKSSFLPFHANGVVPSPSPALTQNLQMAFPVPLNMGPASHMGFSVPHGFPMNMQQHPPTNMQSPFFADEKFGGAPSAFAVSGFPQQQPFNFTGGFGYQDHFPNSEPRRFEYNGYPESSVQTETGSAATLSVKGPTTVYQETVRRDKLGKGPMTVHQENVGRDRSGNQVGAQQKGNKEVKNKDKVQGSFRLLKRPPSNQQVSNAGSAPTTTHSAKHGLQSGSRNRTNQAQQHLNASQNQHASVSGITDNLDSVRLNAMDNGKALLQNHWESKAMHAMPMRLDRNQHKVALADVKHIGIVERRQRRPQYREVGGYNRYNSKEGNVASSERNMAQGSAVDHNQQGKNWNTGSQVTEDADSTENQRNSQAIQKNDSQPRRVRVNETESYSRQNYQERLRRLRKRLFRYRDDIEVFTPRFLSIYESLIPGEDEETKRMELIFRLEKVIQRIWPQSELHLFGSCANAFGVSKSDIDVCLSIDEDESNKPKLVKKIAEILESEDMKNVQALTGARVPIVKFTDPITAISCDICINNILAVENTKLLHDYAQIDIRLQQLAFVVKHWAKSRQINETYQGTLSSYAYVLMCIHFLQQRKPAILPCLQTMEATYRVTVGKVECTYYDQVEDLKDYGAQNRETLGQLLSAFFDYWAFRHDYTSSVISVRTGGFFSKEFKNWTTRIGNERHLICIEDPFEIDHDLGRVVDKHSICVLRQEFLRAAEIMQQDPDPAATLFLPCDPRC